MKFSAIVALCVIIIAGLAGAEDFDCAELRGLQNETYGFKPSDLDSAQLAAKSLAMDKFWKATLAAKSDGAACLKALLAEKRDDPFFCFDGCALLQSMDKERPTLEMIAKTLAFTDLADLQIPAYVSFALDLAKADINTGVLARKYLEQEHVTAYVHQHAMQLDRLSGGMLLYGSMPSGAADRFLISALRSPQAYARNTAMILLALNMTETSLATLDSLRKAGTMPDSVDAQIKAMKRGMTFAPSGDPKLTRVECLRYLGKVPAYDSAFPGVAGNKDLMESCAMQLRATDISALREARRKSLRSVSDESLFEYYALSLILNAVLDRIAESQPPAPVGDLQ